VPGRLGRRPLPVNHGLELDPLTIRRTAVQEATRRACSPTPTARASARSLLRDLAPRLRRDPFEGQGGRRRRSARSWSAFQSRVDLKTPVRFMTEKGPGRPKRIVVTGFSGGGAVTVDATMRLRPASRSRAIRCAPRPRAGRRSSTPRPTSGSSTTTAVPRRAGRQLLEPARRRRPDAPRRSSSASS
jgi:hypothetical protein